MSQLGTTEELEAAAREKAAAETEKSAQGQAGKSKPETKPTLKTFTLANVNRVVTVAVHWPALYPGFEPWVFKLRLALSDKLQSKREEWLALPAAEASEVSKYREEVLNELCDLLVDLPTGFGDLSQHGTEGQNPGSILRNYVTAAGNQDTETQETIYKILEAADNSYWAKVSPREFRETLSDSRS